MAGIDPFFVFHREETEMKLETDVTIPMSELPPNAVTFDWNCLTGVIICGAHVAPFVKRGMTTVMRRPSATSNDIRIGNHRSSSYTTPGDSPPSSPVQTGSRSTRACCFCCLAVKTGNGSPGGSRDKAITVQKQDEPPTPEEIQSWGESFDKLMRNYAGRKVFREFLRSEYSEENMLFWLACEEIKREDNPEVVEEKARNIYEDYISILSPKEVSLDSRVREVINRNMVDPTPNTFDEAQLQIYTLMHRDSYPRFLNSQIYKKLLQQIS
ncbi:regulator of G-protein signaling rgs-2-like isoform X2 [Ostrea edulis]|uniref:regulator of G-protein signaling rgs-2-like isoform X2 n=1 Tax=Ostrea edulis TaxID=37623 RepID=UPI0024AF71B5|nr:regulator of G-protein signaling rgs-2-like isoform X2 [Ostrea edulis]